MSDILTFSQEGKNLTVSYLPNELTLFNIDEISRTYMNYIQENEGDFNTITFSLKNIKSIDSSSVAFLVRAHLNAKKNKKKLILKDIPTNLKKTLDFANLLKDFEVQ